MDLDGKPLVAALGADPVKESDHRHVLWAAGVGERSVVLAPLSILGDTTTERKQGPLFAETDPLPYINLKCQSGCCDVGWPAGD